MALVAGGAQPRQPPGPRGWSAQSVSQIEPRPRPGPHSDDMPREASPEEGARPPGPFRVVGEGASELLITDILHTREEGAPQLWLLGGRASASGGLAARLARGLCPAGTETRQLYLAVGAGVSCVSSFPLASEDPLPSVSTCS